VLHIRIVSPRGGLGTRHGSIHGDAPDRRFNSALSGVEAPWLPHSASATDCPLRAHPACPAGSAERHAPLAADLARQAWWPDAALLTIASALDRHLGDGVNLRVARAFWDTRSFVVGCAEPSICIAAGSERVPLWAERHVLPRAAERRRTACAGGLRRHIWSRGTAGRSGVQFRSTDTTLVELLASMRSPRCTTDSGPRFNRACRKRRSFTGDVEHGEVREVRRRWRRVCWLRGRRE
jgi:hypothetical protein